MRFRKTLLGIAVAALTAAGLNAQSILLSGTQSPFKLARTPAGNLLLAESGTGAGDGRVSLVVGDDQRLGQPEGLAEPPADLEGAQMIGVEADRDQAELPGPVQHPAHGRPGHRQPPGDLVLGQLVLVVEPGHPQQQVPGRLGPRSGGTTRGQ